MTRLAVFKRRHAPAERLAAARAARAAQAASAGEPAPDVDRLPSGTLTPRGRAPGPREATDGAGADHDSAGLDDLHRGYWLTHMRIGFGVFLGETLVVLAYLGLTPHGPHRTLLLGIAAAWLVLAAMNLWFVRIVACKPWRATFSVSWTVVSAFAVLWVCDLDTGVRSPMLFLLFLPISFAAWAFTPRAAAACGVASLASLGLVVATNHPTSGSNDIAMMLGAVLVGSSVLSVAAARNRTRREQYESSLAQKIAELAATDGLTGCAVHRVFHQRIREELARSTRQGHPLSLMIIDLDNFKGVNDSYGHLVGDNILAGLGAGLRTLSRASDLVARLGGDEFAVLMPDTKPSSAESLAQRIRREIPPRLEVPVTLSIGVSGLDPSAPTPEQLIDDADFALYEVKRSGRDSVAVRHTRPSLAAGDPEHGTAAPA